MASYNAECEIVKAKVVYSLEELTFTIPQLQFNGVTGLIGKADSAIVTTESKSIIHCQLYLVPPMDARAETLWQALSAGDLNIIRKIIAEKDVSNIFASNSRQSLLSMAVESGFAAVVEVLLEYGVQVDLRDDDGATSLMNASKLGHTAIIDVLLEHDAQIDAADDFGDTALIHASDYGHITAVDALLKHGAYLNARNRFRYSALIRASAMGYADVVRLLLNRNARVDFQSTFGQTALKRAKESRHFAVVDMLTAAQRADE